MKRLAATILTLLLSLGAFAQGLELLDRVSGHRVSFSYTYSLSRDGGAFDSVTSGTVLMEGNAYTMEGLGLKVTSNGATRLSVDPEAREAVIEKVEKEDIFTNPALFISSYKNYLDRIKVNSSGKDCLDVNLTLDEDTVARFVIKDVVLMGMQGTEDFSTDTGSLPSDYLITDLR